MRLITKIHDYYDGVIRTSVSDKTFTFVRESREIELDTYLSSHSFQYKNKEYDLDFCLVGFCGEIYPFIKICIINRNMMYSVLSYSNKFYYDFEKFKKDFTFLKNKNTYIWGEIVTWLTTGIISRYWNPNINAHDKIWTEIFQKEKVAYFVSTNNYVKKDNGKFLKVFLYPELKKYKFYRIFNAYETFQKIEHYLTNELVKPDEINIIIPDKLKVHSHGFDKYSFRKGKTKHKV